MSACVIDDPRLPDRFWRHVIPEPNSGCWLWMGYLRDGYGKFRIGDSLHGSHRLAFERLIGPVPSHLVMDHLCRTRCCVNPAHQEPVTIRENNARSPLWQAWLETRRSWRARPTCLRGHAREPGRKQCKTCQAEWRAAHPSYFKDWRAKKKSRPG